MHLPPIMTGCLHSMLLPPFVALKKRGDPLYCLSLKKSAQYGFSLSNIAFCSGVSFQG
jgi:hypothetical protein